MKRLQIIHLILLGLNLYGQDNDIDKMWLVILSGSETNEKAITNQSTFDFKTIVLNSADYDNLNPGWFINCIPYESKEEAIKKCAFLKNKGINSYVKFSGSNQIIKDITNNLSFVFCGKYLLLDIEMNADAIGNPIGYESDGNEAFITSATCKESFIPDKTKKLLNSELVVYNMRGEQKTAKIIGFNVAGISSPHWNTMFQWQQEEISEIEISKNLFEFCSPELVAVLDIEPDFEAVLAHSVKMQKFSEYNISSDKVLEKKAMNIVFKSPVYIENDSLLKNDLTDDGVNSYPDAANSIEKNSITYKVHENTFIYINIEFGDFCYSEQIGYFHSNISFMWNKKNE
jgi:hypothetical protein